MFEISSNMFFLVDLCRITKLIVINVEMVIKRITKSYDENETLELLGKQILIVELKLIAIWYFNNLK